MTPTTTQSPSTLTPAATGLPEPAIVVPARQIVHLIELLDHCDEFLRDSSRDVLGELADYCLARPNLTSGWLIDMLGFTALRLRTRLEEAGQPTPPHPQPQPGEQR